MEVSDISTSMAATATTASQAQGKSEAHLEAIKSESENQQQVVHLLEEATGKGQKIDITA